MSQESPGPCLILQMVILGKLHRCCFLLSVTSLGATALPEQTLWNIAFPCTVCTPTAFLSRLVTHNVLPRGATHISSQRIILGRKGLDGIDIQHSTDKSMTVGKLTELASQGRLVYNSWFITSISTALHLYME